MSALKKVFFNLALVLLFCVFPKITLADNSDFNVSIEPPVPQQNEPYTITVTTKNGADFFDKTSNYKVKISNLTYPMSLTTIDACPVAEFIYPSGSELSILDRKTVKFSIKSFSALTNNLSGCLTRVSTQEFSLNQIVGQTIWSSGTDALIVSFPFEIQQQGKGKLGIKAFVPDMYGEENAQAQIINPRAGHDYLIWWDGAWYKGDRYLPTIDDNVVLNINRGGGDFESDGPKKLCIADITQNWRNVLHLNSPVWEKCLDGQFAIFNYRLIKKPTLPTPLKLNCNIDPKNPTKDDTVSLSISGANPGEVIRATVQNNGKIEGKSPVLVGQNNKALLNLGIKLNPGNYPLEIFLKDASGEKKICPELNSFDVDAKSSIQPGSGQGGSSGSETTSASGKPCKDGGEGVATAIGCIHTDPQALIKDLFKLATGIGGGIAFLMMIIGAFQMITSAGNAEQVKAGRERFESAIIGLVFVIFSIFILRFIGVDILGFGALFGTK